MNIKFNYLYRDAGNYKTSGHVIFSNPSQITKGEIEKVLRSKLIDSEFFDPKQFNVPVLNHVDCEFDDEFDHTWNEFDSIEETIEPTTDERTISAFIQGN